MLSWFPFIFKFSSFLLIPIIFWYHHTMISTCIILLYCNKCTIFLFTAPTMLLNLCFIMTTTLLLCTNCYNLMSHIQSLCTKLTDYFNYMIIIPSALPTPFCPFCPSCLFIYNLLWLYWSRVAYDNR